MSELSKQQVTQLLQSWNLGSEEALERLIPLVYSELHRLAHLYMSGESSEELLQTTALINEAYLRISDLDRIEWKNRKHFLGMAAQMMRRILVDFARARKARKRGGDAQPVTFDDHLLQSDLRDRDMEALDAALDALSDRDDRKARVVELRYFGGLTVQETAEVLDVSPETVMRDWKFSKAWLRRELRRSPAD